MITLIAAVCALSSFQTDWKLVWSDEFNKDGLPDARKWGYEVGYIRNKELQFYTDKRSENARVEKGNLVIECRKDNFEGHPITSASINTLGKASWKYGRFEMRAKVPAGKGTWPAFWMLGADRPIVGWPLCGEIDIMEYVGFQPTKVFATVHHPADTPQKYRSHGGNLITDDPADDYHIYALEWFPDRLDFYYDKEKYFTFKNDGKFDNWKYEKEYYILLNLAFGGSWGGTEGTDESALPVKYLIDYVRVYEQG